MRSSVSIDVVSYRASFHNRATYAVVCAMLVHYCTVSVGSFGEFALDMPSYAPAG